MNHLIMSQPEVVLSDDRVFYVHLPPMFDVHVAQSLKLSLEAAGKSQVVLDGSRIRFIDRVGLQTLGKVVDIVQAKGGSVIVENPSVTLRATLELCPSVSVGANGAFILA